MDVQYQPFVSPAIQHFKVLPDFAGYLLAHHLDALASLQLQLAREHEMPLLRHLRHLDEDSLQQLTRSRLQDLLQALHNNNTAAFIENQLALWAQNKLDVSSHHLISEDIGLLTYIRKKSFLHFLPAYTTDVPHLLQVVQELDVFFLEVQSRTTDFYFELFRKKIDEHAHFIQRITDATPGIIYVYDVMQQREVYANQSTAEFLGYLPEELTAMGDGLVAELIHPEDQPRLKAYEEAFRTCRDGEVRTFRYRIKNKQGHFRWLRTTETVFRRKEDGTIIEKIGIAIDVHEQKQMADELRRKEELYRQAQAIARMGHWTMRIDNKELSWSDEMYQMFQVPKDQPLDAKKVFKRIHPEDWRNLQQSYEQSVTSGSPFQCLFRILRPDGTLCYCSSQGELMPGNDNEPAVLVGMAQDVTERQLLIERLQQSEALNKQAQSLAKLGNWSLDLRSKQLTWSDEMYRIFDLPVQSEITLEKWRSMVHPDDLDDADKYLRSGSSPSFDKIYRVVLPNGDMKMVHRRSELIYENDEPVTLVGTTQDITDTYVVEQQLAENQNLIRKITDATPCIIASYNIHTGVFDFLSEGVTKLLGYDTETIEQKGVAFFYEIMHPEDLDEVNEKQAYALADANENPATAPQVVEFSYRLKRKDGQYKWFHTYGTVFDRNAEGQVEQVLNITLDVTEQKQATEKIKEQEYFIQQIADASPTVLYLFDVDTQSIVYVNREVFFVLGYVPEEILDEEDQITQQLYHPDDLQHLPCRKGSPKTFQQVDSMIQYECRLKSKEGEYRWFLVREIVFKTGARGEIKQILGAALDIHRRKEMERTILQNTLQLEQSNSSLEEFAYVASHDLKEPLRKISTFGDRLMASQAANFTDEGKLYLKKIIEASQRMQTMISDLLSISMISGNRQFERCSLQKIFEETLQTLEYKIEQLNARVESTPLPEAHIVPSQFRQLFQNLLSNSLKFVRPHVQPLITVTHQFLSREELVHYQLGMAERYLKIVFADNGIGFENEHAGKIFTIFHRLNGRSEYEGSGIGLAIVKKIVAHHGGIIYAEGAPDKGATFTLILPA